MADIPIDFKQTIEKDQVTINITIPNDLVLDKKIKCVFDYHKCYDNSVVIERADIRISEEGLLKYVPT